MTDTTHDELLDALAELRTLFPDWRFGQLVSNLALAAGRDGAIWDADDAELLASARRLLARKESRATLTV